ncbi:MAG: DUF3316 domain-containing protein [Paludibacter sp.]
MKKLTLTLFALLAITLVSAQNDTDPKYLLTTKSSVYNISLLSITDPYLSPLPYSGVGVNFNESTRRYFSADNTKWSMQDKLSLSAGTLVNPVGTSAMLYAGANYGWGANYHFRFNKQLRVLAGGLWDVDFGMKNVSRNVNNPVNLDMATNLNLTGLLLYDFQLFRNTLCLQVNMQTPLFGYMFVPPGGASYYDMFELGNTSNAFHFSSIHNKRGLIHSYSVDVPFNHSVWRFGLYFQNLKYMANEMVFKYNEVSLLVGTTFDAISFGGKKRMAPCNFISTND